MKLGCPACGAEVEFRSRISVFAVCPYCNSMLVRHDLDLEKLGEMAELPEDISPLQIGTEGQFEGGRFTLVGRLKVAWADGLWNEWFALFDDGREGWLAEAQGFFMMSFHLEDSSGVPSAHRVGVGQKVRLANGVSLQVDDIKEAECVGSEGELPFRAPRGRKSTSVDLNGPDHAYACIEYSEQDGTRLYAGKYVDLFDLKPRNLRVLDGW